MKTTVTVCVAMMIAFTLPHPAALAASWHTYHGDYALTGHSLDRWPTKPIRLWRTKVGLRLPSPVVGGDGHLFCIAEDTTIVALDARKGTRLWTRTIEGSRTSADGKPIAETLSAPPLYVGPSLLVVASESGMVYGIHPVTSKTLWTYNAGAAIQGTPNFVAGTAEGEPERIVVILTEAGKLHAVKASDGTELWKSVELDRTDGHVAIGATHAVLGNCTASLYAVDLNDGKVTASIFVGEECEMAGGIAIADGHAFSGNRSGSFVSANLEKGALRWRHAESEGQIFTTPAVSDSHVVFHGEGGVLYCVERASGSEVWSREMTGNAPLSPVIAGDVVIGGMDGRLEGLSLTDGSEKWHLSIGDEVSAPALVDELLVVGVDDGYVAAYGKDENQ